MLQRQRPALSRPADIDADMSTRKAHKRRSADRRKNSGRGIGAPSVIFGCAVLLFTAAAASAAGAEWKEYAVSRGAFAISMPTPPVIEKRAVATETGPIETHIVLSKTGPAAAFAVVYCDYPRDALFCKAPQAYLRQATAQMTRRMNGTLLKESPIRIEGFPGKEVRIQVPNGILHLKLYAVGNRSYQLYAVALDDAGAHADARRFLASFRLLKPALSAAP